MLAETQSWHAILWRAVGALSALILFLLCALQSVWKVVSNLHIFIGTKIGICEFLSFCTHSLFCSHSHLPVPLWSQSFLIINPTQPTCTAGLLPDRAEVVRETFCKITSASTKVAIIPSISSKKKTKRIHPLGFALSNVHYFCLTDIFDLIRDEI